jgi:polyhydroxyalkanoate synthesis regulator phasin
MQIEVKLGDTYLEVEESHFDAIADRITIPGMDRDKFVDLMRDNAETVAEIIAERIPKGELTYESIRENADQLAETVTDRIDFCDEDRVQEIADQAIWDHSRVDDIASRVEELEGDSGSESAVTEWWNENKHREVIALLEEYAPGNGCSAGNSLTEAIYRGLVFIDENDDLEGPWQTLTKWFLNNPASDPGRITELEKKVDELQEVLAIVLKAVSFGGRVAGSQLGTAMFEEATKRATENNRNAYDNDIADEKRHAEVSALFAALEGAPE